MVRKIFIVGTIVGFIYTLLIFIFLYFSYGIAIKSKTLIKPKIEIIIENNKVDTVYVYKLPLKK